MKLKLVFAAAMLAMASGAHAANYYVNNVVSGSATDTLIANPDGSLLNGGIVAIGYFTGGAPSSSLSDIGATIASFNLQTSVLAGSFSEDLGAGQAGYYQSAIFAGANILAGDPLIGQGVYLFAGNAATLATSTAWGIVKVGNYIQDNPPLINQYTANTSSALIQTNIVLGSIGNSGANSSFKLATIPEPSAVLLGAVGALGLLRRRRA